MPLIVRNVLVALGAAAAQVGVQDVASELVREQPLGPRFGDGDPIVFALALTAYARRQGITVEAAAALYRRRRGLAPLMPLNRKCRAGEYWIQGGAG